MSVPIVLYPDPGHPGDQDARAAHWSARRQTLSALPTPSDHHSRCCTPPHVQEPVKSRQEVGAFEYGVWSRDALNGQLIHHSDRVSNYTSFRFAHRLADNRILPSMGSTGDSFDNALMENFWSTLKIELVYRN
jgi:transposase InsO family protein